MAIKTNYLQGGSYNAIDLVNQFGALFTDGMLSGGVVNAHSPANLSVDVSVLKCMKAGLFLNSDSSVNVPIVGNTSGYNRIDIIAVDLDNQSIVAVQGTPSSAPTVPILTGNKVALVQVLVGNNVSVINQVSITDMRQSVDLFGAQLAAKTNKTDFTASLASSGWEKNAITGKMEQWIYSTTAVIPAGSIVSATLNLPISFSTQVLIPLIDVTPSGSWDFSSAGVAAVGLNQCTYGIKNGATAQVFYICIRILGK